MICLPGVQVNGSVPGPAGRVLHNNVREQNGHFSLPLTSAYLTAVPTSKRREW